MNVGDIVRVSGCITKEKFILGQPLVEIERILGFHAGRFRQGIIVIALMELPGPQQFELAAYSNVATHRRQAPSGLDIDRIKSNAMATWATTGFERLVKVRSAIEHDPKMDPNLQYPPGQGAPQWQALVPLLGRVVGIVMDYPLGRYRPV